MPEKKRHYFSVVVAIAPIAGPTDSIDATPPEGAYTSAEIIEDIDFTGDEDWERLGYMIVTPLQRRIRQSGWPRTEAEKNAGVVPSSPDMDGGVSEPEPPPSPVPVDSTDDETVDTSSIMNAAHCWNCGSMMLVLPRGPICPQGCAETPPVIGAVDPLPEVVSTIPVTRPDPELPTGSRGPKKAYKPTKESSPPTSYPQGPIETTD